jgi:hypothetical protein
LFRPEDLEALRGRVTAEIDSGLETWLDAMTEAAGPVAPGLEGRPEEIWFALLCLNRGVFATEAGRALLLTLLVPVVSARQGSPPLWLTANPDGWGIPPSAVGAATPPKPGSR